MQAFRAAHPEVQLVLHNVTGKDGLALLRSDAVDLAVGSMLDVPTDLGYAPVYSLRPDADHGRATIRWRASASCGSRTCRPTA